MKKLVWSLILSSSMMFAQDLIIQKQKKFQLDIEPNLYKSGFSINLEEYDQKTIESSFQKLIEIVKEYPICKGGEYNINPHYKKKTYIGYIDFNCQFSDEKRYEKLLDEVKTIDGKLSQRRIQASSSENILEESQNSLEKMALAFPSDYVLFLQESLKDKECVVSKISFSNRGGNITPFMLRSAEMAKSKVTLPIKEKLKHTMSVDYTFTCTTNK